MCVMHVATERVGGLVVGAVGLALSPAALVWVYCDCAVLSDRNVFSVAGSSFYRLRDLVHRVGRYCLL